MDARPLAAEVDRRVTVLSRYILRSLLFNYLVAVGVMLSLYVMLDMFINMDEFTEEGYSFPVVLRNMAGYYAPNLLLYFKQLGGVVTAFACLATVARMRRLNEMTAMLASGVSLFRIAVPVVAFGVVASTLLVMNTEWGIPRVAHLLARDHDDADGRRAYEVLFLPDRDGALLSAGRFHPQRRDVERLLVLQRDESGSIAQTIEADRARWEPLADGTTAGRWRLERGRQRSRAVASEGGLGPQTSIVESYPVLYESDLSPEDIQLRQSEAWIEFLSMRQLNALEPRDEVERGVILHAKGTRVTAPIIGMILLLLGLPCFLDRTPSNVLEGAGKAMALCGACYVATYMTQSLRATSDLAIIPWIPIFVFATLAVVLVDRIRT